jgi:ketosteroid isomerase-like protein
MTTAAATLPDLDSFCARYLAAWNDHDPAAMGDLVTDDVVWEDPALPGHVCGIAGVAAFMRAAWVGFPDLRFDETDTPHRTAGGDQVAWRWRMRKSKEQKRRQ